MTKDVDLILLKTDEFKNLLTSMRITMVMYMGVGLAANQVGSEYKLFITGLDSIRTAINPKIIKTSKSKTHGKEGCLSIPDERFKKLRHSWIQLSYVDELGEEHIKTFTGWSARVVQHEMDHLNGKLCSN